MNKNKIIPILVNTLLTALILSLICPAMARDSGSFSQVDISGHNRLTTDRILYMCPIDLGRHFEKTELEVLLACLVASDEFDSVNLDIHADRLKISVVEKAFNKKKLSIGASVSSSRGPAAQIEVAKPTLLNRPLAGRIKLRYSKEFTDAVVTLEGYKILGTSYRGKSELSFVKNSFEDLTYDEKRIRLTASFGFPIGENSEITLQGGIQESLMYNVKPSASPIIIGELGNFTYGFASISYLAQSTRQVDARTQYKLGISQTLFLADGTLKYGRTRLEASSDTRLFGKHRIKTFFEGGAIIAFSDTSTRSVDRFFLGGRSFRGFAPRGIGPVDGTTHLGGNYYAVATIETHSPIAAWNKVALEGGAFTSIGSVWGLNNTAGGRGTVDDGATAHASVGVSFTFHVNAVPIHFYYSIPIKKKHTAKQQKFGFYISSSF